VAGRQTPTPSQVGSGHRERERVEAMVLERSARIRGVPQYKRYLWPTHQRYHLQVHDMQLGGLLDVGTGMED